MVVRLILHISLAGTATVLLSHHFHCSPNLRARRLEDCVKTLQKIWMTLQALSCFLYHFFFSTQLYVFRKELHQNGIHLVGGWLV